MSEEEEHDMLVVEIQYLRERIAELEAEKKREMQRKADALEDAQQRIAELTRALNNLLAAHDAPLGAVAMVQLATQAAREALGDE